MKGRNRFTAAEAAAIRGLLTEIRQADQREQRKLRDILRNKHRFYITDFRPVPPGGFAAADFDERMACGKITVCDEVPRP